MDIQDLPIRSPGAIVSSQMHFLFSFRNVLGVSRAKNFVYMTGIKGIFGPYRVVAQKYNFFLNIQFLITHCLNYYFSVNMNVVGKKTHILTFYHS
jgi:hypothetical protein